LPRDEASILIVDDVADTREVLQRCLTSAGYRVHTASGVVPAIESLEKTPVDLVITDLRMPEMSGLSLVRYLRENMKETEVMMITGYATVEGAVEAVKTGAEEYLAKPFTEDELTAAVGRALEKRRVRRLAQQAPENVAPPSGMIGESAAMQVVLREINKAATTDATVLITGESGTGKELVGRAIHYQSSRAPAPFVPINCGAIPSELVESELFGHTKGAFTGATAIRNGFFQAADGGSIFLDEIGDTSPSTQVKLLRVLEDQEVYMVGSSQPTQVDVRVLASTNKDLSSLLKKGTFREDLFFRLSVITIVLPPLRERKDDILLLVTHFARKLAGEAERPPPEFTDRALQVFRRYAWPGNVRELLNLLRRLVVMQEDSRPIDVPDLPRHMRFSVNRGLGPLRTLAEIEADHIRNVLDSVQGNKTQAAKMLGIDRKTLRERLKSIETSPGE
jgi:DNA-binding NtrC family response regulator